MRGLVAAKYPLTHWVLLTTSPCSMSVMLELFWVKRLMDVWNAAGM